MRLSLSSAIEMHPVFRVHIIAISAQGFSIMTGISTVLGVSKPGLKTAPEAGAVLIYAAAITLVARLIEFLAADDDVVPANLSAAEIRAEMVALFQRAFPNIGCSRSSRRRARRASDVGKRLETKPTRH